MGDLVEITIAEMKMMTDEQRLQIMSAFCGHCGCIQPEAGIQCQCWNDE